MNWLEDQKIPLGRWMKAFFDWIIDTFPLFFEWIDDRLSDLIDGTLGVLELIPAFVLVAAFCALGLGNPWRSSSRFRGSTWL